MAIALDYGLHPVADYDDFELDEVLEPAETSKDGTRLFRRFKPSFPGSHPSLIAASRLNCAFVLRKGKPEDAAAAAPAAAAERKRPREEVPVASGGPAGAGGSAPAESKYKRSSKFARAR